MPKSSFRRALLEVDRELARVPSSGERDVRALFARRRRIPWRLPAFALAAALAVLLFMRAGARPPAHVAGFVIDAPASSVEIHDDVVDVLATSLELDVPDFGH